MDFELLQDDLDIEVLDLNIEPCTGSRTLVKSEDFELVHSVQPVPHNSLVTKSQRLFSRSSVSSQNFDNTHTRQQTSRVQVRAANSVTVTMRDKVKRGENRDRSASKICETPDSVGSHLETLSFDNINSVHKRGKKEEKNNDYLGQTEDSDEYDLVIVGSGVSGLYALFTILSRQPQYKSKRILMIEQSGIIGGRLRTDIIQGSECTSQREGNTPVAPDSSQAFVACEEGGMRFCLQFDDENEISKNQVMPCLVDLITDLRPFDEKMSNIEPFKMVPDGPVDFRRCWFSGRSFTSWYAQQNPGVWENIFYLDTDERNLSPEDIYSEVYRLILKENYARLIGLLGERKAAIVLKQQNYDKLRMIQDTSYWYNFRKYFTWNNVAINQYTMRSLMTVMGYSQGCIKMLEMSGFQCFTMGRGNAGIIIQMSMSHKVMSDSFYCFTYGFGALIDALKAGINHKLGSGLSKDRWILLNHQVTDIKLGEGSSKLSDDFTQLIAKNISKNGDSDIRKIKAKDLILAVPRKAFETISISKIPDHDSTSFRNNLVDSVVDVNMTKINLYFDEAWWNKDQVYKMYGNNTTDLPIAQVNTNIPHHA